MSKAISLDISNSLKRLPRILLMLALSLTVVYPQASHKLGNDTEIQGSLQTTRGFNKRSSQQEGHAKYIRFTQHDGNLVAGSIVNAGLLSYSQIGNDTQGRRIGWPKGANLSSYIFGSYFWVASEVLGSTGDTIRIVSDYYRIGQELAPDGTHYYATMPLPTYYNLDQPDAQETPLVYGVSEDVGVDGLAATNDFGEGDGILQPAEDYNDNGELDLRIQNTVGWFAISHRRETWPEYWPVGTYPGDNRMEGDMVPGPRAGRWNGEFGAFPRADQESYYAMDDRENDEFEYFPFPNDTRGWPDGRRGLGISTEARAYQWNARLAEDIMIGIYDISLAKYDDGTQAKPLENAIVGMYVDPDMGGSFSNDDAAFRQDEDITFTWNRSFISNTGLPLGYFGFAFLESPGLPNDGIDNDGDGLIDESQNNGIDDDGDWTAWEDLNGNGVPDNEDTNFNGVLDPGEDINENGILDIEPVNDDVGSDGIGPEFFEYAGPDADGTESNGIPDDGEPNFEFTDNDESDQVGLTSFYLRDTGQEIANDELYWNMEIFPGTFFTEDNYQRDIAFSYGSGFISFDEQEPTHRYAIAMLFGNDLDDILRNKRTMQVIYDNDYSFARPPRQPRLQATGADGRVFLEWDDIAERSRDPIYGFDFEAYYVYRSTEASFNEIKTITDGFGNPLLFKPMAIFDLDNGLRDLHPVRLGSEIGSGSDLGVAYNMGTDSGLEHFFIDTTVTNGRTYYYAIASIDQGYHPDFFPQISEKENLSIISPTESPVNIQTDPLGRAFAFDPNTAEVIPTETSAGWVAPDVTADGVKQIAGTGTGSILVEVYNPLVVKTGESYRVSFGDDGSFEDLNPDYYTGVLNRMTVTSIGDNVPVKVLNDPPNNSRTEEFIFDGIRVVLQNDETDVDEEVSSWESGSSTLILDNFTGPSGNPVPRDFEVRIMDFGADTSLTNRPTNFQVWDVTDPSDQFRMPYIHLDVSTIGELDHLDAILLYNKREPGREVLYQWRFKHPDGLDSTQWTAANNGDVYKVVTKKTFDRFDQFEFTMAGNAIDDNRIEDELDRIYTVPDPYVAVNRLERQVINQEEGRGDRKIDFVNLPENCKITIFTSSGKIVREISHTATDANRRASWDLRTRDGLEVAYGIYFYVVETGNGAKKTGKFAIIK